MTKKIVYQEKVTNFSNTMKTDIELDMYVDIDKYNNGSEIGNPTMK